MLVVVLVNDSSLRSFPSLPSFSSNGDSFCIRHVQPLPLATLDNRSASIWNPENRYRNLRPTYLLSKFPAPSLQNPNAQIPNTAPKIAIPPGPLVGKLRLYLIVSYPPAGGISLLISPSPYLSNRASRVSENSLSESVRHVDLLS